MGTSLILMTKEGRFVLSRICGINLKMGRCVVLIWVRKILCQRNWLVACDRLFNDHRKDFLDIVQGYFSSISPSGGPEFLQRRTESPPSLFVRLYLYAE